jgi:hypothetical protein
MSTTYDKHVHSHVMVTGLHNYPLSIVLAFKESVWVPGNYGMEFDGKVIHQIEDKAGNSWDEDGDCLLSVPLANCSFLTTTEAEHIEECLAIDEEMRANAR